VIIFAILAIPVSKTLYISISLVPEEGTKRILPSSSRLKRLRFADVSVNGSTADSIDSVLIDGCLVNFDS
jgi:hypothetical protein